MKNYGAIVLMSFIALPAYAQNTSTVPASAVISTAQLAPKTVTTQTVDMLPKDPKHFDTTLPVEITADSLEVLQHESKAIFKGNVVAVQGEIRLKSDVMIVHYKQHVADATGTKPAAPTPTPTPVVGKDNAQNPGDMGAITLIEVQGNVFMATPEESAKGDNGNYDVPTRMLHLYGNNVVLTRDKNIMRGTAMEYNMETGRSILTNVPDAKGKPTGDGRVRSVFVPTKGQGKAAPVVTTTPAPTPEAATTPVVTPTSVPAAPVVR